MECSNYRGISLLSIPGKIYTQVLQQRMKKYVEESLAEEQAGLRSGRGTVDQVFVIRQLAEKFYDKTEFSTTTSLILIRPLIACGKDGCGKCFGTMVFQRKW